MKTSYPAKFILTLLALLMLAPAGLAETAKKSSAKKSEAKKSTARVETKSPTDAPAAGDPLPAGLEPAAPAAEPMGPDDRIAFMQTEAAQPQSADSISTGGLIFKTLGAMLLVVGLLFFGAWGLKKAGFGSLKAKAEADAPELTIVNSVQVGNGRTISSVKFGSRVLLVGSTAQSFTLLADGPEDDSFAPAAKPRSVAEMLADEEAAETSEAAIASFDKEFARANEILSGWQGGQA